MNEVIQNEINKLKEELPKLQKLGDEYLFSLVCFQCFYNNGILEHKDYLDVFVDGKNDGGIDLITLNENESGQSNLVLIQSKYIEKLANKQDVLDIFKRMHQTYKDFQEYKYAKYNTRLKRIFTEKLAIIEDSSANIEFVLFLGLNLSENIREEIRKNLDGIDELQAYQIRIFSLDEITRQIENIRSPKEFVEFHKIKFSKDDGILKYGENGIMVNISVNSLREIYDMYRDRGLFEQNFRYYIKNKKIDDNIRVSLEKKREDFWFLNNGIIIGCKDFNIDGYNINLNDFSIINGCQTTTLIGEYKGKNEGQDFALPCKIVKAKDENPEAFGKFISEIAEASNSQKPISDRDLKSNAPEQRHLQLLLKKDEPQIFLEIKRGDVSKKRNFEKWQKLKNDLFGQLILSFNLQQPGTAKNEKSKIFAVNKIYDKVFKRKHDKDNIVDLLKLNSYYTDYLNKLILNEEITDNTQENVLLNGRFMVLSIIGFFLKYKRGYLKLNTISNEEEWESNLTRDDLEGPIFSLNYNKDDFIIKLESIFLEIINALSELYSNREQEEKTISNFFKAERKYYTVIQRYLIQRFFQNKYRENEFDNYMEIFELGKGKK